MRGAWVFIVAATAASCGGAAPPPAPLPPVPVPDPAIHVVHHPIDAAVVDAEISAPVVAARGGACGGAAGAGGAVCEAEQTCLRDLPGGYCASRCGRDGLPCGDGATCVQTPRDGDVCARACTADRDCRVDAGYTCDPVWHACAVPGFSALVPATCPVAPAAAHPIGADAAFAPAERLATDALYMRAPAAVLMADGLLIVAAAGAGAGSHDQLIASPSPAPGGSIASTDDASAPALARLGATVFAAYRTQGDHPQIELLASRDRGATWTVPIAASDPADCADLAPADTTCPDRPRLATSERTHALYLAYSSDAIGTRIRTSHDGGISWATATTALTGARGDLATGADGVLHVIAMAGGSGGAYGAAQHAIEYTASSDGGRTFRAPVTISAPGELVPAYFANPTLALDDRRGWIYVGYARGGADGAWSIVVAASKDKGKTWTRTQVAGDGCAIAMVPNLAVDGATGTLHVAWYDRHGVAHGRFAHAACGPGAVRCTDRGAIASDFAELGTNRLDATWLGDSEALVVDERRRLLHAVWTEPVATGDGGAVSARVHHAIAKLRP